MKKMGLLIAVCLLGMFMLAGADVNGSLGANATQVYKVNLQEGAYTVEFIAPGTAWQANVTYTSHS